MSVISRSILRKVNNLKDNADEIYTFECDTGQTFHIITPEQLKLLLVEYSLN